MHAFALKALCRAGAPADIRSKLFTGRIVIPCSEQICAYHNYHPLYNTMRSAHAPSSAREQPDTEDGARPGHRDIMEEAFGHAYATRATEEGYGERYEESVQVFGRKKDTTETQRGDGAMTERDPAAYASVSPAEGSEVRESACPTHDRPLPGGAAT